MVTVPEELPGRRRYLAAIVVSLILLVVASVAILTWRASQRQAEQAAFSKPPPTPPPPIEPLELKEIAPEVAKAINDKVPFTEGSVPGAKPFRLAGSANDIARAVDCLASAIFYEAGAETLDGQRAVAQVVLNRVRHPAFPHSVCGVVYQGSTRTTGCQFSFSCDGSMRRVPSAASWSRLRDLAQSMLKGAVYKPVGLATHYHTDWVLPYWSAKLDKIRAEGTHLFFRWNGWWGTPPAFRSTYSGSEPLVLKMATLSPSHAQAQDGEVALDAGGPPLDMTASSVAPSGPISAGKPVYANPAGDFMIFLVDKRADPALLAAQALAACGGGPYCKVMMWTDRSVVPTALPISDAQLSRLAFSYLRNNTNGYEKSLWNCDIFPRPNPKQCMKSRAALSQGQTDAAPSPTIIRDRTAETAPWLNPKAKPPSAGLTPVDVEDEGPVPSVTSEAAVGDRAAPRRRPGGGDE
jgi:spore germination cell wall hydrolase CwlJ-like protein